ncbi:leucine-rich repeat-containing protein 51-like [Cylas formicarius]|uniref:leucine-rich repeat-containing protein 51-like n=1 Tax=Cylas formicarius TaxID=197179 RepID=UPI0029588677|nr:leucine-rich repeat-containing protein 51-like [Cylas formicarius]
MTTMSVKEPLSSGKPADFSFRRLKTIDVPKFLEVIGLEGARYTRVGGVPDRGPEKKFLTKSLWLNNNKLKSTKNLDELVEAVLEHPIELAWADFSFNYITEIDESVLKFPNLKILYFHGNCIDNFDEIFKLKSLKHLKTVTFQGNPISNHPRYRSYVVSVLPQIVNLDFSPVLRSEKMFPMPPEAIKKIRGERESKQNVVSNIDEKPKPI